ncbi:MAG: NusG domain II-containing protein [Ruminococcus sp.]|nr:NusG domain II-containing protein [Ruminococcus sp.]
MKKHLPIIITVALLIVFIVSYLVVDYISRSNASTTAEIYKDSKLIRVVDLSKEDTFTISNDDGSYNVIQVNELGEIGVVEASCSDNTCIHTGFTKTPSKPIICLPNRLEIRIVLEENNINEDEIDSYAY